MERKIITIDEAYESLNKSITVQLNKSESKALLKWRKKQKKGKIMSPKTFDEIKSKASAKGYDDPEAVAGRAYWNTAKAKFKKRKKK